MPASQRHAHRCGCMHPHHALDLSCRKQSSPAACTVTQAVLAYLLPAYVPVRAMAVALPRDLLPSCAHPHPAALHVCVSSPRAGRLCSQLPAECKSVCTPTPRLPP
eukprot:352911-Chlamydomonas_euryale.AAC.5